MKKETPNAPKQKESVAPKAVWRTATSLKPGPEVIHAAAQGMPYATAIRDAWAFPHKIVTMSREDYERLIERCGSVNF